MAYLTKPNEGLRITFNITQDITVSDHCSSYGRDFIVVSDGKQLVSTKNLIRIENVYKKL